MMDRRLFLRYAVGILAGAAILPVSAQNVNGTVSMPHRGNLERTAILDALRAWIKSNLGLEVVFVVKHLKVKNGWAWINVIPQSPDGKNHYEDLSALLRKGNDCWAVVAVPSGECAAADDPEKICTEEWEQFIKVVTQAPFYVPIEILQ